MGLLVDGQWHDRWYNTSSTGGRYVRKESVFRNRVAADGSTDFRPASGRYHLYVSYACPWAHRTLIYRVLKGLENHISVSVVNPLMMEHGWTRELYQMPGVATTVHFDHIKAHYYRSHNTINPSGVVPKRPIVDFNGPHGRGKELAGIAFAGDPR